MNTETQRVIKFRRAFFYYDGMFYGFKEWGPDGNGFIAPSYIHGCKSGEDQQFTGLLDKHGKEVYYGDLLRIKFKTQYYDLEAIYEVIDRGFTTQFLMRSLITPSEVFSDIRLNAAEDFEWFAGNRLEISHSAHNGRERSNDIEVIGNIFTTPELIEK